MSASTRPIHEMEKKWQDLWEKEGTYHAEDPSKENRDRKFYGLIEFPYPSGEGLHVGHPRAYTAIDVLTRKRRMEGKNVLYPIGWDAFGLPTENFAIKFKIKPQEATKKNIANFTRQIKSLGMGFDWSREIDTTDPAYFKWTQWQFLRFYNAWYDETADRARPIDELPIPADVTAQGLTAVRTYRDDRRLAYKASSTINWCPRCKIGLANEEAQGGECERCGNSVEKREKKQWMIRITKYAERLIRDLSTVDYLDKIKSQQVNWIGKSEGAFVDFAIKGTKNSDDKVTVFTTRPDTIFGATYVVLAPEHPLVSTWINERTITNTDVVQAYREVSERRTEMERTTESKEKTGTLLEGVKAINPATKEALPIWISDYVLSTYGTGAIMAVPAHDERDLAFAKTFGLSVKPVVAEDDHMIGSGFLNGMTSREAKRMIVTWLEQESIGERAVTYKLRDWVFSRQRYWGEPIPIIDCPTCGFVPVPDEELPVLLPDVEAYEPTDTGESPLSKIRSWVETSCPTCGGKAERETDTMPNWAGSSWYFLRYCDPKNDKTFADAEKLRYWMPVDLYNGGMEHTTLHLLYSRFWYKVLWDLKLVPTECGNEPYRARRSQGLIMAEGGVKMSKSKGNVVNPDEVVARYGGDVLRVYEMFIGPYDQSAPWDTNGIEGVKRFLDKVWGLFEGKSDGTAASPELETLFHQTIKKISEGIDALQFNTCVSHLMILVNAYQDAGGIPDNHRAEFVQFLAPFAPHLTEEIWGMLGQKGSIHRSSWPKFDEKKLQDAMFELVIQVNGKVRDRLRVPSDISDEAAKKQALSSEKVQTFLEGKEPKQVIYVPGRIVSVVV